MKNKYRAIEEVSKVFEWDKWCEEIPYLNFPQEWEVKAIPPVGVGIIRYNIRLKDKPDTWVSVYLDCYKLAGFYNGKPYWEIYPYDNDTYRCGINETSDLLEAIAKSLEEQSK